jgi:hypothetical protein
MSDEQSGGAMPPRKPARTRGAPAAPAQSSTKGAPKAAAKVAAKPKRKPPETGTFVHHPKGPDLRADLRAFITARPAGWGHDDWVAFLDHLRERGHDTSDEDGLGLALERERLAAALENVQGMGPRRVETVVGRYDTLWSAREADVEELCRLPGMNRALAEKVRQALR